MNITVLSPHTDDAVFSLAEHMLTWIEDGHDVTVLSLYAGIPFHDEEGRKKHTILRSEHERAMKRLGAQHIELEYFDDACRRAQGDLEDLADDVYAETLKADVIVGPTGIHHPDHLYVPQPCRDGYQYWWYDEIPYYVLYPHEATQERDSCGVEATRIGCRPAWNQKLRLVTEYRSQINDELMRMLMVPERVWC